MYACYNVVYTNTYNYNAFIGAAIRNKIISNNNNNVLPLICIT